MTQTATTITLATMAALLLLCAAAGADTIVRPPLIGPNTGLPVVRDPLGLDGTGRIPNCNAQGVCNPGGYGSSGKSGVRDYYRDLRPDTRGQTRWRPADDYRLNDSGYRQPDAYIDLNVNKPRYATPPVTAPRRIDGNPAISGQVDPARHADWCSDRYRSYRPADNTFQPYSGPRRSCNSPFD